MLNPINVLREAYATLDADVSSDASDQESWPLMTDRLWPAFEQALTEFNRKYRVDWTSRELQPSTAEAIAERAYEIEARNRRNRNRKARHQAMLDCGLVRVRVNGKTFYE